MLAYKTPYNNRHCLAYVYGHLLKKDIREFVVMWNTHRMRANKHTNCPQGVPDDLYFFPEIHGKCVQQLSVEGTIYMYMFLHLIT